VFQFPPLLTGFIQASVVQELPKLKEDLETYSLPVKSKAAPGGFILRILWLPAAHTYTLSSLSMHTPAGELNVAEAPAPSAEPDDPKPAYVVTTALGVIFLTTCAVELL
jgi:hypothetical protein